MLGYPCSVPNGTIRLLSRTHVIYHPTMKKPNFLVFILLAFTVTFTSCFEIREEVNMKADGSGEIVVVVNLSKSKGKLKQYMKMDKVENFRIPSEAEIESILLQAKNTLQTVQGISYVERKSDWSNFIFTITTRFENIDALNDAIATLSEQLKYVDMPTISPANFNYEAGIFDRLYEYESRPNEYYKLPPMQRHMLDVSQMVSIYRFEKKIIKYSHKKALVSPSGKAIMLKLPLSDLITGRGTLENSISFK